TEYAGPEVAVMTSLVLQALWLQLRSSALVMVAIIQAHGGFWVPRSTTYTAPVLSKMTALNIIRVPRLATYHKHPFSESRHCCKHRYFILFIFLGLQLPVYGQSERRQLIHPTPFFSLNATNLPNHQVVSLIRGR